MVFIVSNSEAVVIKEEAIAAPVKGMNLFASIFSVISCVANQVSAS